ncbi:hypothetical protein [Saccharopolyspora gloriosae]|uniref:hypothetical protein n=1 Tax=Saccharopolyspora gloriosae TaxID=455344 RepID=UPI001FB5928A|nr:hypothetical protein [Saccharopolyspora gloriosae]
MRCTSCGDELPADRSEWGYDYCVKADCVEQNFTGVRLVEVAVNKSASQLVAAGDDIDEVLEKTRNGDYAKKNTTLGAANRGNGPVHPRPARSPRTASPAPPARAKRWTPQQEKIVKVFNEMGLRPREMMQRAPHLGLSVDLITEIVCSIKR